MRKRSASQWQREIDSGKKMEEDDGLRIVEFLRGRLLSERVASRAAKKDADQMETKFTELENQLRAETKSRNRAEKRLKLLVKKLELLNIQFVSEDSEHSSLLWKNDISSVSSTTFSNTKEPEYKEPKPQMKNPAKWEIQETLQKRECLIVSLDPQDNGSHTATSNHGHGNPVDESLR